MDGNSLAATTAADLARWDAFELGETRVDPASREVTGPGGQATLEPRVMQVLLLLVSAEGGVVTREELSRVCWNSRIVGDDALNRTISAIRRVARTAAADGFGVETITGTGYRLTGATVARETVRPALASDTPASAPSRLARRLVLAGGALALTGAGAWALWARRRAPAAADPAGQARLAMSDGLAAGADQAIALLGPAIAREPGDPELWGQLALAWRTKSEFSSPADTAAAVKACETAAARALALDPKQADARTALIILRSTYGDWLEVERSLRAVLADAPRNIEAAGELAMLLQSVGRRRACGEIVEGLAARLPLSPIYQYRYCYVLWGRGRVDEADRVIDRALALWPRHPSVWFVRLWLFAFTDRVGAALAQLDDQEARPIGMADQDAALLRTSLNAMRSLTPSAVQAASEANLAAARAGPGASVTAIMILAGLKRLDDAFTVAEGYLLRRGANVTPLRAKGSQATAADTRHRHTQVLFTPATAPMRADQRFLPLCEACGLAAYWRESGHQPDFLSGDGPF